MAYRSSARAKNSTRRMRHIVQWHSGAVTPMKRASRQSASGLAFESTARSFARRIADQPV